MIAVESSGEFEGRPFYQQSPVGICRGSGGGQGDKNYEATASVDGYFSARCSTYQVDRNGVCGDQKYLGGVCRYQTKHNISPGDEVPGAPHLHAGKFLAALGREAHEGIRVVSRK